jgi:hypothetical protein
MLQRQNIYPSGGALLDRLAFADDAAGTRAMIHD